MELVIDTSTTTASIALSEQGKMIGEIAWQADQNHTVELSPTIARLLTQHSVDILHLSELVVAKGPGSFNGLRVGMATAKGLAFALGIPLVSIGTLEAIAFPHAESELPICPILQAGRREIATAMFQKQNNDWRKLVTEYISTIDDLCKGIDHQIVFCGEIEPEQLNQLKRKLGNRVNIPEKEDALSRASYLAKLGWCKIEAGNFDDLSTIQPLYLKKPSITKPKRREHDAMSHMRA